MLRRGLGSAILIAALASPASAQSGPTLRVEIEAPEALREGDRRAVIARVHGAGAHPLLLTPRSEGTAVEVVRGRLLRAEARDPAADVLEFRVPVVARSSGTAVLRVEAAGYTCERRCRLVRAEASLVLNVAPAARSHRKGKQATRPPGERTSSLSWVRMPGAEGCLASAPLARAVEDQLDRHVFVSAADADLAVEGRAERVDDGWRAVIQVTDAEGAILGERTLESAAEACDELGEMATVAVALMIDPLTAPAEPDRPDPPPDAEPRERVVVRTERVEVPVEVPVPVEPPPRPGWRVEIDAALVGSVGLSPLLNLGGMSELIFEPPGFVPFAIHAAVFPFSRAEQSSGAHADFFHVHGGVQICPLGLRDGGLALHGCLGVDAGAVFVVGGDLAVDETERVIGQGHVALRGHWDVVGPLTIRLGLHLLIPFRQDDPFTSAGAPFYTPEPVAGMADLGVGLHFD